ncbi:MAG: maltose alpha-D-glucosyltransferase [Deltaproteobacteria bacterium CG_4_9_14_3_um_filter_65_9]|nr:MAG: maltose alpha-D-glucosyltransferase [Deltaproteobacteria bacterium CG_4_9_14_3_um_filter_65_9]
MAGKEKKKIVFGDDPSWYKDAVIYELHVRSFYDSDGDGVGDFRGLTEKLDYLQDLGVTALWLLPFYPSPLKDDGYDISNYTAVNPAYGALSDFRLFLREAHGRGLRVITELVLNHTSEQHPWFQRARRSPPGSKGRDFYVWSDSPDKYRDARIIFKDFESANWTWDPLANAYYWHRFYSHQPDLNFDNPEVRRIMLKTMQFWLAMGVDGLRLDAVPYLYEREGTSCENLPETHKGLKTIRKRVDERYPNRMLLAEANQWPEDAVAYFGEGDECHMAFHFPLMPRMFMAVRMEDRYPIIDILSQTPPIPANCQWALFLRNHDELTLEMVTDEERDYMYRVYTNDPHARINLGIRRRLYPLLGKDRKKFELMNALLLSLPGTPVIYYGDEIGMGDNIYIGDRNGVRTPMQWNADRNAGFSRASSQKLFLPVTIDPDYHYETVNVEARQNNSSSMLWWMKRVIALRKQFKAFGRGSIEFLTPENHKVLAFLRSFEDELILVVANLSRFPQFVELDLSSHKGKVPVELVGKTEFPPIKEQPYFLTLGAHIFYWFSLERPGKETEAATAAVETEAPVLQVKGGLESLFRKDLRGALEKILPAYLRNRRWFGGKARRIKGTRILEAIPLANGAPHLHLLLVQADYTEGDPEVYSLPVAFASGPGADRTLAETPGAVIARTADASRQYILFDALQDKASCLFLLDTIGHRRRFRGQAGEILGVPTRAFRKIRGESKEAPVPVPGKAEQSNSSVIFGDRMILKIFRRVDPGINPDLEIGTYLTEEAAFPHAPPVAGSLQYARAHEEPMTLAILMEFVPNRGDAWRYTLDSLGRFFERVMTRPADIAEVPRLGGRMIRTVEESVPPKVSELVGSYLLAARRLGERTAEFHLAMASNVGDPAFAPEPFTPFYQRSLYQSMRNLTAQTFALLQKRVRTLPDALREQGREVLEMEARILKRFQGILARKITAMRIRIHGDYHLGQVLYTGKEFVLIDFEGEPARSLSDRRIKRSPMRDVAGMLRSFHYASYALLTGEVGGSVFRPGDVTSLEPWADYWNGWVSSSFLQGYVAAAREGSFLPRTPEEMSALLDTYLLEKAIYELGYELNNRPDWVKLPLLGIRSLMEAPE